MSARTVGAAVALLTAVLISGCTATAEPVQTEQPPQPVVTPSATPTEQPAPAVTPTADADSCDGFSEIWIMGYSEGDEEATSSATWNGRYFVDRGASEFARGAVTTSGEGQVVAYTVAEGDAPYAIQDRLCMDINSYMTYHHLGFVLYPGDVLKVPVEMEPFHGEPFDPEPRWR